MAQKTRLTIAVLAVLLNATLVAAQPTYINLGRVAGGDISADGDAVVGSLLDSSIDEGRVTVWRRGQGVEFLPGGFAEGTIFASDDLSVLAMEKDNIDNWGDINCFLGNEVAPQTPPCAVRNIAHRWTLGTGWVNLGSFPRSMVTVDYSCNGAPLAPVDVWIGGTRCDANINPPNDISGDGRYVVGGAYVANTTPRSNGCAPSGICQLFTAYVYDAMTDTFTALPVQTAGSQSRADRVNGDGSVIVGYDNGPSPDPDGAGPLNSYSGRRLTVWQNGVETILDPYGSQDGAPSTSDGTQVVGAISATSAELEFGPNPNPMETGYLRIAKWSWDGANWNVANLGRPDNVTVGTTPQTLVGLAASAISADGNTVVGTASYKDLNDLFSPVYGFVFIWRPTLNGGQPMLLDDYIASELPMGDTSFDSIRISGVTHMSADGNTLLVDFVDDSSPCLSTFANGIIDLNGAPCEPPRQNLGLVSQVRTTYISFGAVTNCFVSGTGPLNYQWQRKDLLTAGWVDLVDDFCEASTGFTYKGSNASQLRIGLFNCDEGSGDYRCVVTNPCGSITTDVAHVTITGDAVQGFCISVPGDMNNDGFVGTNDIFDFVASLLCKPFDPNNILPADRADVNLDGEKNGLDVQPFVEALLP